MKRILGATAANWLRKPENQQKVKRTARQLWDKYQKRKGTKNAQPEVRPANRNAQGRNTETQPTADRPGNPPESRAGNRPGNRQ